MRARTVAAALLAATLTGCGGDGGYGGTGPTISPVGTWTITTYNGAAAPPYTTLQTAGHTTVVTADMLVVNANGTFVNTYTIRETIGTTVTITNYSDAGTWSKTGPAVFSYQITGYPTTYSATLAGETLTTTAEGNTFVFVRVGT